MIARWRIEKGKQKAHKRTAYIRATDESWKTDDWLKAYERKLLKTTKTCSNYCCGNPRKWFGELPRQWEKINQKTKYEMKNYELEKAA